MGNFKVTKIDDDKFSIVMYKDAQTPDGDTIQIMDESSEVIISRTSVVNDIENTENYLSALNEKLEEIDRVISES